MWRPKLSLPLSLNISLHHHPLLAISQCDPGAVLVSLLPGCISITFLSHISVGFQSQAPKSHMHRSSCLCPALILAAATAANQATSMLSSTLTFTGLWQTTHTHTHTHTHTQEEKWVVSTCGQAVDLTSLIKTTWLNFFFTSVLQVCTSDDFYWRSVCCWSPIRVIDTQNIVFLLVPGSIQGPPLPLIDLSYIQ